jgi:aldehyde dehydrogenase (NAD+)
MNDFGMKEALSRLGLKRSNPGISTGSTWYRSTGAKIESYSPVDGRLEP